MNDGNALSIIKAKQENDIAAEKPRDMPVTKDDYIDNRAKEEVGKRKVKSFQFLFPQFRKYYTPLAKELMSDLDNTIKGERFPILGERRYVIEYSGVKRLTSEAIARIKDTTNATYNDIKTALEKNHTRPKVLKISHLQNALSL